MSVFDFNENASNLGRRNYDLLNSFQLIQAIDSVNTDIEKVLLKNGYQFGAIKIEDKSEELNKKQVKPPAEKEVKRPDRAADLKRLERNRSNKANLSFANSRNYDLDLDSLKSFRSSLDPAYLSLFIYRASNAAKSVRETSRSVVGQIKSKSRSKRLFTLRLHQQ